MEVETGPMRCDSSLSMVKIQPVNENNKSKHLFTSHKFDPEIEELYQLHSANQKRTELFRCFLYAILFYCLAHVYVISAWICNHNNSLHVNGVDNHDDSSDYGHGSNDPVAMPQADDPSWNNWDTHFSFKSKRSFVDSFENSLNSPLIKPNNKRHSKSSFNSHHDTIFSRIHSSKQLDASDLNTRNSRPFSTPQQSNLHSDTATDTKSTAVHHNKNINNMRRIKSLVGRHAGGGGGGGVGVKSKKTQALRQHFGDEDEELDKADILAKNMVYIVCMMVLLIFAGIIILLMLLPIPRVPQNAHIPVLIWSLLILLSVAVDMESSVSPRLGIGWAILETFLIWVTLPMRIRAAFFYTASLGTAYLLVTSCRPNNHFQLGKQIGANIILLVMTNLMGLVSFYLSDKKQRRAFLDTRQSLEMKLLMEEQSKEQERLLLSVLPEHLALKMRQDLGNTDGQFKNCYMSRHENVSILYADIVGFTAISSTYSASELVKILNELFARFDRLAEKYSQIRIKILGDCYYCICGAPEERPDHAILCVHMGLSMVKAIKYVREKTKSCVDMRVGVHTGQAGRVHVSETTLGFLNDEFEVEPAHGEKREEILRIAGIKTYFIVRPLVPFKEVKASTIAENGDVQPDDVITKDMPSDLMSTVAEDSNASLQFKKALGMMCKPRGKNQTWKHTDYVLKKNCCREMATSNCFVLDLSRQSQWLSLKFQDAEKESEFTKHKDPYAGIYSAICPTALVSVALANFFAISFNILGLIVLIVGVIVLSLLSSFAACEDSPLKSRIMKLSGIMHSVCKLESELWVRRLVSILTAALLIAANLAFMVPCLSSYGCYNITREYFDQVEPPLVLPNTDEKSTEQSIKCLFPAYSIGFETVFLLSVTLLPYLGSWVKSFIILGATVVHIILIFTNPLKQVLECSERLITNEDDRLLPAECYLALFAIVVLGDLFALTRRLEKSSRVLFLWKTDVELQREKATQLRQKNEALVYNILPQHVAAHFLGSRRRKHEELYSQSYSEVGILFASMPNFSDFYSEETVNNQGLECLRFLNEVISDFDALLDLPKFADHIIKIKTIGSTYMTASGLNPLKQAKPDDPIKVRWHHLALLVEFALELKVSLNGINEQSFNHFVLKMGVNHGPITAGVIGARKPHYDIWGNSVNVASRMESTGRSGCIQVTTETYRILRLFGYVFEQRGLVNVKGKGQLMTYYLINKGPEPSSEELKSLLAELEESQPSNSQEVQ
ncbi:Adenylate cyclase type 3 [Folsomia candida]|uniref:adenylate cyclase n=1 Tax=Folsomia candida TaxID=158441 RepID=A0A226EMZ0_FOLCA|nr:Adenylate cyclase type 3 [Folsomia candida]